MKKVFAVFLLLIMLVASMQPVIGMHFCKGELHSVDLFSPVTKAPCCAAREANSNHGDNARRQQGALPSNTGEQEVSGNMQGCCDTHSFRLSTDEYQSNEKQIRAHVSVPTAPIVWLAVDLLQGADESEGNPASAINFPPKGLYRQHSSIRNLICIYRI